MAAGAIEVHYQPIVRVADLRIDHVEALARWPRADGRSVPPSRFIPIAEQTGLIVELGESILSKACSWRARLQIDPSLRLGVCVNVSARELDEPGFAARISARVRELGLDPELVTVEITESGLLGDLEAAGRVVEEIRGAGARVPRRRPSAWASPRSPISRISPWTASRSTRASWPTSPLTPTAAASSRRWSSLAHELGIETIAEGVETEAQFEAIRDIGCDFIQGYLVSKALPPGGDRELRGPGGALDAIEEL